MTKQDFTTTFSVEQSQEKVFKAITDVRGWWSGEIEGATDKLGAEFIHRYEDVHRCKMKITELVPGERIVWLVLDNYFNFTEDKTEWKDTQVIFEVGRKGDKSEIRFTHLGLVPEFECFRVCSNASGCYINGSLRSLITAGTFSFFGRRYARGLH